MGRKANILINEIKEDLAQEWYGRENYSVWPLWIDDILSGVARLDWYGDREQQIPLATGKILKCLITLDIISTESVQSLLGTGRIMANKYAQACRIAHPFIVKSLASREVLSMKYPQQSIVSEAHGIARGYNIVYND